MAEVVVFHHALGLTDALLRGADEAAARLLADRVLDFLGML